MPRCILLAEYAHGVLRLQEKSACLVLVDGHAFFLWKCRIAGRFLIETDSEDSVANVFFI